MIRRSIAYLVAFGLTLASVAEAGTVRVKVNRDKKLRAGADAGGRVLLYTPKPFQAGSTHSHFDSSAAPDLLMEPANSSAISAFDVDLTKEAMQDLGWPVGGATVQVSYNDAAGQGFNDAALGEARKLALEMAAGAWGVILGSQITINVQAGFAALTCDETGGTLARAGPRFSFMDFAGGEPGVWYPGPLAESLAASNLSTEDDSNPSAADLSITFNSGIDNECLREGSRYYYGLDDEVPVGEISFVNVAMHEMGHGLGFVGFVDSETGVYFRGAPDIFTTLTYDNKVGLHWDEMTRAQRAASAVRSRQVGFDGAQTTARADGFLSGRPFLRVKKPKSLAGAYGIGTANFGPPLTKKGVRGKLVLVNDGSANPTFGCDPIVNSGQVSGKIAVIDRGECLFVTKVRNAQDAGAKAVIIIHNESGFPPDLGGSDSTIEIPAVRVGKKDGRKIKRAIRK